VLSLAAVGVNCCTAHADRAGGQLFLLGQNAFYRWQPSNQAGSGGIGRIICRFGGISVVALHANSEIKGAKFQVHGAYHVLIFWSSESVCAAFHVCYYPGLRCRQPSAHWSGQKRT